MRVDTEEFRHACDSVVRFTQQRPGLTDEERELVVNCVQTLEHILAPPSALERAEETFANLPLID
jgi:hypothetical protein